MGQIITIGSEEVPQYWQNLSLENIRYYDPIDEIEKEEQWLPVVGYEGLYDVSNCGRVKSLDRRVTTKRKVQINGFFVKGKIKPSFDDGKGYRRVEISKNGNNRKIFVHRLVAEAFLPNPKNKPQINHTKGQKSNNVVWQLEWATKSEDRQHAIKVLGAGSGTPWKNCNPKDHPMYGRKGSKAPSSRKIICNETGVEYESIKDASDKLGYKVTTLKYVLMGITKKSKIPYTFKYA